MKRRFRRRRRFGTRTYRNTSAARPALAQKMDWLKRHRLYVVVLLCWIAGILVGAAGCRFWPEAANLGTLTQSLHEYLLTRSNISADAAPQMLFASFLATAKPVLVSFLLGFAVFGFVGDAGVVFYKGFGIGYVIGTLCMQYGLQGLLVSGICILLPNLLSCAVVCYAAAKCMAFSLALTAGFTGNSKFTINKKDVLAYLLRGLIFFAAALVCALIDFGVTPLLVKALLLWI